MLASGRPDAEQTLTGPPVRAPWTARAKAHALTLRAMRKLTRPPHRRGAPPPQNAPFRCSLSASRYFSAHPAVAGHALKISRRAAPCLAASAANWSTYSRVLALVREPCAQCRNCWVALLAGALPRGDAAGRACCAKPHGKRSPAGCALASAPLGDAMRPKASALGQTATRPPAVPHLLAGGLIDRRRRDDQPVLHARGLAGGDDRVHVGPKALGGRERLATERACECACAAGGRAGWRVVVARRARLSGAA